MKCPQSIVRREQGWLAMVQLCVILLLLDKCTGLTESVESIIQAIEFGVVLFIQEVIVFFFLIAMTICAGTRTKSQRVKIAYPRSTFGRGGVGEGPANRGRRLLLRRGKENPFSRIIILSREMEW